MNNLKRILSLALASVMVLGMMVVGASAANFTDNEDITHEAAADVMNALGIIGGYEDGSFRPNGDVTRAEMAKMLSVALNGGKDPNVGLPTTMPYSDVKTTDWFAEYVMYCSNLGIIGGRGDGSFDPYGKVTAAEAAKMMLVALGFEAEVFELVGANWSTNTMRLATTLLVGDSVKTAKPLSLFGGMTGISANQPLNRDQAAQLIYNGIQSNTVKMALTGVTGNGTAGGILGVTDGNKPVYEWSLTGDSLLKSKFKAEIKEGILENATYTASAKTWSYTVEGVGTLTFAEDVSDCFMQNVRVIYKKASGSRINVLAITSASDDVLETCAWGELAKNVKKETLNGYELGVKTPATDDADEVTYTLTDLPVYDFLGGDVTSGLANTAKKQYAQAKLIDNDGDGRVDCVVVTDVNWTTVAAVRPTYLQLRNVSTNVTLASNNVEEGLAAGDYVTYTQNPQTKVYTVKKAETVTGLMNATMKKSDARSYDQIQVAGNWYNVVDNQFDTLKTIVGNEALLVLVSGYAVSGKALTETAVSSDAVMVVAKASATTTNSTSVDASTTYLEIRILKADGKTEVLRATSGNQTAIEVADLTVGKLYTYKTNPAASGCVILTEYAPKAALVDKNELNPAFYDKIENTAISIGQGLATADGRSFRFADEAKIFVMVGGGTDTDGNTIPVKYGVVSGADINKWGADDTNSTVKSVLYANRASNGFTYAQEGALIFADLKDIPGAAGEKIFYGYVTAKSYFTKTTDGKTYIAVPLWNGVENVTVLAEKKDDANTGVEQDQETEFTPGTLVSYKDNGNGTANSLKSVPGADDAVIAWDGVSTVKFLTEGAGKELKIDDKTTILYVDDDKGEGVANGNITIADYVDAYMPAKGFYANVMYVKAIDTDNDSNKDHVEVLIVDTSARRGMMGGSVTAIETKYDTKEKAAAALKALNNGAYSVKPQETGNDGMKALLKDLNGLDDAHTNILLFKFACDGNTEYTLKVTKAGTPATYPVTQEGAKLTTGANSTAGIFYYNADATEWGTGSYTYTITTGNTVIDTGSFELQ